MTNLINDALKQMKQKKKVTEEEVNQFIRSVDTDNDAKINKKELFEIFKKVITNGRWLMIIILCFIMFDHNCWYYWIYINMVMSLFYRCFKFYRKNCGITF